MTYAADTDFSTTEVCRATGVTYRQANYWDDQGIVKPSVRPAGGGGTSRRYSRADIGLLYVVMKLSEHGIGLQKLRGLQARFTAFGTDFRDAFIIVGRNDARCVEGGPAFMDAVYDLAMQGIVATAVGLPDVDGLLARNL